MLKINNLSVTYFENASKKALNNINLELNKGEILGIIGESGCGKTTIVNSIMDLLPETARIEGQITYNDNILDKSNIGKFRGTKIAYISQQFSASLSDYFKIGSQFDYLLKSQADYSKKKLSKIERNNKMISILAQLDLASDYLDKYPFQLAGGEQQRICIGMAISCNPELLIADEATSSLDSMTKEEILDILSNLNKKENLTILIISHDLPLIIKISHKIAVIYNGTIVEELKSSSINSILIHPYTELLLNSKPDFQKKFLAEKKCLRDCDSQNDEILNCPFFKYCKYYQITCSRPFLAKRNNDHFSKCIR